MKGQDGKQEDWLGDFCSGLRRDDGVLGEDVK